MFRKLVIVFILGLALSFSVSPCVQADPLDDQEYTRIYIKMGNEWYIEIPSVDTLLYTPPEYELCATVLHIERTAGEDAYSIIDSTDYTIRYDWDNRTAHISRDGGEFKPVNFTGSEAQTALSKQIAENAFLVAYGTNFYFRND